MYNEQGKKELIQRAVDELKHDANILASYSEVEKLIDMLNHNPSGERVVYKFLMEDKEWRLRGGDIELVLEVLAPIANEMLDYDYYEEIGMVDKKEDKMSAMKENINRIARQLRSRGETKLAREVLALDKVASRREYDVKMTVKVLDTEEIDSDAILEEYIKNAVDSKIVEVIEISAF